jgi:hypothetical protein
VEASEAPPPSVPPHEAARSERAQARGAAHDDEARNDDSLEIMRFSVTRRRHRRLLRGPELTQQEAGFVAAAVCPDRGRSARRTADDND